MMNIWLCVFTISASCLTLDISKRNNDLLVSRVDYEEGDLEYSVYISHFAVTVDQVYDGNSLLWKAKSGQKLLQLTIYRLYGKKKVAYLQASGPRDEPFLHFKYKNKSWTPISDEEYYDLLTRVLFSRKFVINGDKDDDAFHVYEHYMFGLPSEIYISGDKYDITSVVERNGSDGTKSAPADQKEATPERGDSQNTPATLPSAEPNHEHADSWTEGDRESSAEEKWTTIWRAKGNETCTFVVVHGIPGDAKLVHIFVQNGMDHDVLYFGRQGGKWENIGKEKFYKQLETLDEMVTWQPCDHNAKHG